MVFESFKRIILEKRQKPQENKFLISRPFEENKILQILNKRQKNNCIVIGAKGVGKTSVLQMLKNKVSSKILIVDDVHLLDKPQALELREKIIKKEVQCLVSTTKNVFKSYNDFDNFFKDNFTPVLISEPNNKDMVAILNAKIKEFESYHDLRISSNVVEGLISLSARYLQKQYLPASAVDVLDSVCAQKKVSHLQPNIELEKLANYITELKSKKIDLAQKFELKALEAKFEGLITDANKDANKSIQINDIYEYFSQITNLNVVKIKESFKDKILNLEERLNSLVIGQENAIKSVCDSIKNHFFGLDDSQNPLCLCFDGPQGVGKYKLAKEIAKLLFDDANNLVAAPISDYQVVLTENSSLATQKGIHNCILIYKTPNDFVKKIITFNSLEKKHARIIAKSQISEIEKMLKDKNIKLEVEEQVFMFLTSKGYSEKCGVEGLRDLIKVQISDKIKVLTQQSNIINATISVYFQSGALEVKLK